MANGSPQPERWLVVAAAAVEINPLRSSLAGRDVAPELLVAGVGLAGDPAFRTALDRAGPGPVLNLGFAGGLGDAVAPGSVVLTTGWVRADGPAAAVERTDDALRAGLRRWLSETDPHEAAGVTVEAPFHDAAAGAMIHRTTGAATVEMEGERWARLARQAGRRFVAVRVVSDRADLRLPLPRHRLLTADGGIRLGRWLRALPGRERSIVGEWRALRQARADWLRALASLDRVSRILAERLSVNPAS